MAGSLVRLEELPFCVAWADCGEINRFFYVTHEEAGFWDGKGIDWRGRSMENLVRLSLNLPASGEKRDDEGRPFLKVMLHKDAIGPSRLLIPHLFDDVLGADYEVALPERTCAIAYRKDLTPAQAADVSAMIDGCYAHGTEPMSPDRFAAGRFWEFAASSVRQF